MTDIQKCSFCDQHETALQCSKCGKFCCVPCSKNKVESIKESKILTTGNCPECGGKLEHL